MNIKIENTEIRSQSHLMDAEGTCQAEPKLYEVRKLLQSKGYDTYQIQFWYDNMMGFWRWSCSINQTEV